MEPCYWSSGVHGSDLEGLCDGFLMNPALQAKKRNGSGSACSLVLDGERGELVEAAMGVERKGMSAERSIAALRHHSEAERKRRARINAHLDTLRSLVPGTKKMDKASLLGEVISHLRELKGSAAEASDGLLVPMDVDEVKVELQEGGLNGTSCLIKASLCCDGKPGLLSDLRQALDALPLMVISAEIATLEGRMKNVFLITTCKGVQSEDTEAQRFLASSVHQALRSILDKFSGPQEFSSQAALSNKRRRASLFNPSVSSSSGDHW